MGLEFTWKTTLEDLNGVSERDPFYLRINPAKRTIEKMAPETEASNILIYQNGSAHNRGHAAFGGGTRTSDGRVFLVPHNSGHIGVCDRYGLEYSDFQIDTTGEAQYIGAAHKQKNEYYESYEKLYLLPNSAGSVVIFDFIYSEQSILGEDEYYQRLGAFAGTVELERGTQGGPIKSIVCAPHNSEYVMMVDIVNEYITSGPQHGMGEEAFYGAIAQDGKERAVFVPYSSAYIAEYSIQDNYFEATTEHHEGERAFAGGAYINDGINVFVPYDSEYIGLYNFNSREYERGPKHGQGLEAYKGCEKIGRYVVFAPYNAKRIGIYDTLENRFIAGPEHNQGEGAFCDAIYLGGRSILFVPFNSQNIGLAYVK